MIWRRTDPCDPDGRALADRHYSRRTPGAPRFVPPGESVVLVAPGAVWVTGRPRPEFIDHAWGPCWSNSIFRREPECPLPASELIRQALAATRSAWGLPPEPWGLITFVAPSLVRSSNPGCCYRLAGFRRVGETQGGHGRPPLLVFSCPPDAWPEAEPARDPQLGLWSAA